MNTLTFYLMQASAERRQQVLEFWELGGQAEAVRSVGAGLPRELVHRWSIGTVLDRLDDRQRAILWKLLDQRHYTLPMDDLAEALGLSEVEIDESLADLVRGAIVLVSAPVAVPARRFVFGQGAPSARRTVHVPVELAQAFRTERRAMEAGGPACAELPALLEHLPVVEMQALAARWGVPHAATYSRRELAVELEDVLRDESAVERRTRETGTEGRALFEWLRAQGGIGLAKAARDTFGATAARRGFDRLSEDLLVQIGYRAGARVLAIPDGVGAGGRRPRPEPPALRTVAPPGRIVDHGPLFAWDILIVATQVLRSPAEIRTTDGGIHKRAVDRLSRFLHVPDDPAQRERFDLLLALARELGLVEQSGKQLRHGPALAEWGALDLPAQARRIVEGWLTTLGRAEPSQFQSWLWGVDRPAMRRRLLDRLHEWCRPGEWYTLDSVVDRVRAVDPFIVRTRQEILRREGPGGLESVLSNWDVVDARLIQSLIWGMLLWLGVVAVGQAGDGTPVFQVTPFGAHLIAPGDAADLRETDERPLVVQPNFEVLLLVPRAVAIYRLGCFADLSRTDRVSSYVITRESVLAGVELGLTADEMVGFLADFSQKPVPQNVAYSITDWARQYKPLRFSRAVVVEVDDPAVLDELERTRAVRVIERRLGPRSAVIAEGVSLRSLATDLRRRGYSPRLPDEDGTPNRAPGRRR